MISATKQGLARLLRLSRTHNTTQILFSVRGGGCNGLTYQLTPLSTPSTDPMDEVVSLAPSLDVVVGRESAMYLVGTTIDWVDDTMGSRFQFHNPKGHACGCGKTFAPRT